jgi:hypothetical protein
VFQVDACQTVAANVGLKVHSVKLDLSKIVYDTNSLLRRRQLMPLCALEYARLMQFLAMGYDLDEFDDAARDPGGRRRRLDRPEAHHHGSV